MLPLVALVGRPNVGKSTIFNALTRTRDALVHDQPGVTRDRNYGVCRLDEERPFIVVDTGGIAGDEEGLAGATARQARAAAGEADLVLFVVDGREGASSLDDEILAWLRKLARPTVLVINKIDGTDEETVRSEFARYGFSDVVALSAAHRQGIDELLEEVGARLPAEGAGELLDTDPARVRIAFVGRPNVGKSTLVNRLLGEERMIASEVPGTTRDFDRGGHGSRRAPIPLDRYGRPASPWQGRGGGGEVQRVQDAAGNRTMPGRGADARCRRRRH